MLQTAMETAVLACFHRLHRESGFPPPDRVLVIARESTPCGRYVDLESDQIVSPDGHFDLGGGIIEMPELPNGMMAVALVTNGRLKQLEFVSYGGDSWDGNERDWKIVRCPE